MSSAEHGITVNAVAPGEISTPMTGQDEALVSPRSSYVTGSSYVDDGGLSLMAARGHDGLDTGWRDAGG